MEVFQLYLGRALIFIYKFNVCPLGPSERVIDLPLPHFYFIFGVHLLWSAIILLFTSILKDGLKYYLIELFCASVPCTRRFF